MRARALASVVLAATALLGACGSDDSEPPSSDAPRPVETAEELPRLPRGWEPHTNRAAGFALGRPPGWAARDNGTATTLTAPDELVVLTISADRTADALGLAPTDFATATIGALQGYEKPPEPGAARRFRHRYDAAWVRAEATAARTGVRQELAVVVVRREELAVVTAVVAASARHTAAAERRDALRAVRTVRTRPVG